MRDSKSTDWDSYYDKTVPTASLTRKITERKILNLIARSFNGKSPTKVLEFGGANSCFVNAIRATFPDSLYIAVDTNKKGLSLLSNRFPQDRMILPVEGSVLHATPLNEVAPADVVFSAGLIEHFDPKDTRKAIEGHFHNVREGGIVLMTFPTPTWLYRATRKLLEGMKLWIFHDERPLGLEEVLKTVSHYGDVLHVSINWPVILTQGIVVARKRPSLTSNSREPAPWSQAF